MAILASVLLVACGGGDSGGGNGTLGIGSQQPSGPQNPPPLQRGVYSGNAGAATVNEYNSVALAREALSMAQTIVSLAAGADPQLPSKPQTINRTQPGPDGGQRSVRGVVRGNGSGWLLVRYFNYKFSDPESGQQFTYNGEVQFRYPVQSDDDEPRVKIGLSPLTVSGMGVDISLVGLITRTSVVSDGFVVPSYTGNFVLTDNVVQVALKAVDYRVVGNRDQKVTGRFYDSRTGYVDVKSIAPLQYPSEGAPPVGGTLHLVGEQPSAAELTFLNPHFASIGLDRDGDSRVEETVRWDNDNGDDPFGPPTPGGIPQAAILLPLHAVVGTSAELEGKFSHSPDGHFIHYQWELLSTPVGSTASLQNANTAVPTLVADIPGDYLVRVEVSDATGYSTDAAVVTALAEPPHDSAFAPRSRLNAGPDRTAAVGMKVTLDARESVLAGNDSLNPPGYQWTLHSPPGSQATLENREAVRTTFTPDVAGIYYATVTSSDHTDTASSRTIITAAVPLHFDPPAVILQMPEISNFIGVADMDGNNLPDIVLDDGGAIRIIYNLGNGRFARPETVNNLNDGGAIAIGDINGDERDDLVTTSRNGIAYVLQQDDGTLGPVNNVPANDPLGCDFSAGRLVIAALFGASRNSVLLHSACLKRVLIFEPVPEGAVGSPVSVPFGGDRFTQYANFIVGDFTGDGVADLAAIYDHMILNDSVAVVPGSADGTFGDTVYYGLDADSIAHGLTAADLNGDGSVDAAVSLYRSIILFYQQPTGGFGPEESLPVSLDLKQPLAADADGDGRADLVSEFLYGSPDTNGLAFFLQQPDGSLAGAYVYPAYQYDFASSFIVSDINVDGVPDIVFVTRHTGEAVRQVGAMIGDPLASDNQGRRAPTLQRQSLPTSSTSRLTSAGIGFSKMMLQRGLR